MPTKSIAYKSKDSKPDLSTSQVKALTCQGFPFPVCVSVPGLGPNIRIVVWCTKCFWNTVLEVHLEI